MKKYYLLATALAAMVSCTSDDYVGDNNLQEANGQAAISFNSGVGAITRADKTGAAAATDLNTQFFVYGIKNESTNGAGNVGATNLVFKNYVVKWGDQAYSTTSNTKGWEYVNYTLTAKEQAKVLANSGGEAQTIKYWDYGAADYTFYAFTADPTDISGDKITVTKVQDQTSAEYDNGYTVTLVAGANLDKLYFSERVNITKTEDKDRNAANTYGGNVTFRFHNAASKVRVAMYETIPGYSVTIKQFKVDNDAVLDNNAKPAFADMDNAVTTNFAANFKNVAKGTAGTLTVTYHDNSVAAIENHPILSFGATKNAVLNLGENLKATTVLGESATAATFDTADDSGTTANEDKAYTSVFPNETNEQNLKLKLDYTLTAPVTGETIEITDATAEIPAKYLQWKPGFAYTYIFKITDDKLYPITFDAVEVLAEDGNVEYITTVTEPSITTYAKASNVITDYEYLSGSNIYVTVMEGSAAQSLTVGTNANLYTVTLEDMNTTDEITTPNQTITEASVANALKTTEKSAGVWEVTDANNFKMTVTKVNASLSGETSIDAGDTPDGNAITINCAKFTPAAPTFTKVTGLTEGTSPVKGYYTITGEDEYTLITDADAKAASQTDYYEKTDTHAGYYAFEYKRSAVKATGTYVAGTKYYTDNTCATEVDTSGFTVGTTNVSSYYLAPTTKYKVIKVVDKY